MSGVFTTQNIQRSIIKDETLKEIFNPKITFLY